VNKFCEDRPCSKCGQSDIYTCWAIYDATDPEFRVLRNRGELITGQEIMVRHCRTCTIEWAEEPLDANITPISIEQGLRRTVDPTVRLREEGKDRYRVFVPYIFGDGDHLVIFLKRVDASWIFSDEGHTLMSLGRSFSALQQNRVGRLLTVSKVEDKNGELIFLVTENQFDYALKTLINTITSMECIATL